MKSLLCLIFVLFAFNYGYAYYMICNDELKEAKCNKDKLSCETEKVIKCYEKKLGVNWTDNFLTKEMKEKYKIDDLISCQAYGVQRCLLLKCWPSSEIQHCFVQKYGHEKGKELYDHLEKVMKKMESIDGKKKDDKSYKGDNKKNKKKYKIHTVEDDERMVEYKLHKRKEPDF